MPWLWWPPAQSHTDGCQLIPSHFFQQPEQQGGSSTKNFLSRLSGKPGQIVALEPPNSSHVSYNDPVVMVTEKH